MAIMFLRSECKTLSSLKKLKIYKNNTLVARKMKSTCKYIKQTSVSQIWKITVFRDVVPYSVVHRPSLKKGVAGSHKISTYQTTLHHISADHSQCEENIKSTRFCYIFYEIWWTPIMSSVYELNFKRRIVDKLLLWRWW